MDTVDSIWSVIANVKTEITFGETQEIKNGTKHFKGGSKVYVIDAFWGTIERVAVIGRHRMSLKYICLKMDAKHLEDFRLSIIYSPTVIELTTNYYKETGYLGMPMPTKEYSERILSDVPNWENY
jgi:hypothetical protein